MDAYLRRIAALPRLDAVTEHDLAVSARHGDLAARDELITSSLPLVVLRGRHLGLHGQRLLDAVQAGTIGLIEAVDHFDPSRGCRLSTYAWWWIGRAMSRSRPSDDVSVGSEPSTQSVLPPDLCGDLLTGLDADLAEVLAMRFGEGPAGRGPTPRSEVAEALGLSVSQVRTKEAKALSHLRRGLAKVGHRAPHEHRGADPL